MRHFKKTVFVASVSLLITASQGYSYSLTTVAGNLTPAQLAANYDKRNTDDYGDAPGYGAARHDTSEWNFLGTDSKVDDGVLWSRDGGVTWGNDTVYVGDNVLFRFTLWSSGYGRHNYDQVKAWVDWDQSGSWENDNMLNPANGSYVANETVLAGRYDKNQNAIHDDPATKAARLQDNELYDAISTFTTGAFLIDNSMIGDLWLRARAQCNHVAYNLMSPYGYLNQGEVEDWRIQVDPVPEPATMLLFGTGLASLVGSRLRRKK